MWFLFQKLKRKYKKGRRLREIKWSECKYGHLLTTVPIKYMKSVFFTVIKTKTSHFQRCISVPIFASIHAYSYVLVTVIF